MRLPIVAKFLVFLVFLLLSAPALALQELRKAANLMSASEAILATISIVSERFDERLDNFTWSTEFSERTWQVELNGIVRDQESSVTMSGYLWGGDEESLIVTYSGMGSVGGEPVSIHGKADWLYDDEAEDYHEMDFRQITKLGENSIWGWMFGAEVIAGASAGGAIAFGGTVAATGGLGIGAAPWIALGGAGRGAVGLVTISAAAKVLLESDSPPPAPDMPERPEPPQEGETLSPREGEMLVALLADNMISGSADDGIHLLSGNYYLDDGVAEGEISLLKREE